MFSKTFHLLWTFPKNRVHLALISHWCQNALSLFMSSTILRKRRVKVARKLRSLRYRQKHMKKWMLCLCPTLRMSNQKKKKVIVKVKVTVRTGTNLLETVILAHLKSLCQDRALCRSRRRDSRHGVRRQIHRVK